MGRARDLAAISAGGTLSARVTALEADIPAIEGQLTALDAEVDGAVAAAAAASASVAGLAARPGITVSVTDNFSTVPIGTGAQSFWRALQTIDLSNVVSGEKYLILGQGQVENPLDINIECAPLLTWTSNAGPAAHDLTGHNLCTFGLIGNNVRLTGAHYFPWVRVGLFLPTQNYTTIRVYNSIRHRSSDPVIDGSGNQATNVALGRCGLAVVKLN